MIKRDYIDDGFGGGSEEDVDRLMGEVEDEDGNISFRGTVSQIMNQGNFRIKVMVRSGESRLAVLKDYGGTILGIPWETKEDKIKMKFEVNLSQKVQKILTSPALEPSDAASLRKMSLTRRMMLSQIYAVYDPLGLLCPITIKYKLLL